MAESQGGIPPQGRDEVLVTIPPLQETAVRPENIPLEIIYQDAHLAIVNKPKGWLSIPQRETGKAHW